VNRQLSKKLVAPLLKEIKQKMFLLRGKKVWVRLNQIN
jgi:hypothetical protein